MAGVAAVHKMRVAVVYQQLLQMAGISLPFTPTDTLIIRTGDLGVLGTVSAQSIPLGVLAKRALRTQIRQTIIVTLAVMDARALTVATGQLA